MATLASPFSEFVVGDRLEILDGSLDMDFTDFDDAWDFNISSDDPARSDSSPVKRVEISQNNPPAKSRSSTFMKKSSVPKEERRQKKTWTRVEVKMPRINLSRRPPSTVLYAFPNFDRCDSLLYLTSSLTRHLNTGDFLALYKLLTTHLDKECLISMHEMVDGLSVRSLTKLFRLMDDIHPDRIVCVYETKVIENQIFSSAHMKFTDCKAIFNAVASTVTDPMLKNLFTEKRDAHLRRKILLNDRSEEEKEQFRALVTSQQDLLVHKRIDFAITFDPVTKKVTHFLISGTMTSMEYAPCQFVHSAKV